ncbi:MAG: ATP-binding protein, partial [Cyclobacteriaceae bacterium]|nr:ATP-binding protein [Cyclobacteriaceae bacterium]
LKLTIADRTFEMIKQSKEIEEQNKLLKLHSEEIELQRDAISEKNQELESSQEEILTVNHQLEELNEQLEKQVAQRTLKIKSTIDELQKTNKELDTFIYRASHDLKSPISRIMGLSSLAKLELPDTVDKEYFNLIELAATDMKNLLAKLTHVHELLNKKITIKSIDVPSLLGSIRESLKHFDQYQDTKYSFNIKNGLSIHSDEDLIRIIISNLMENALIFRKETPTEAHHIDIQLYEQDGMIHIIIRDNGIGVLPEYQNDLFNMFYRASDQSKGTGLGLYVVRMAVDLFKGSIHINSKPDEFTEFTILLPV